MEFGTSTLTPISTALFAVFMSSFFASLESQSAPPLPGATMIFAALTSF